MSRWRFTAAGFALLLPSCAESPKEPAPVVPTTAAARTTSPVVAQTVAKPASPVPAPAGSRRPPPVQKAIPSSSVPQTPDALVDRAEKEIVRGDLERASGLLDQALAAQPVHRKGLYLLAVANHARAVGADPPMRASLYIRAAESIRKLRDTGHDLSVPERQAMAAILYDEARMYAVGGKPERAVDTLADAIDAGFDAIEMVAADADFASIRTLPRFAELMKSLEQKARERAASAAKLILAGTAPFAFQFELPSIDGKRVNLDDLKGNILLVNFWGTWCPPCRKELPHFAHLVARYGGQGLTIVGLNYERGAESEATDRVRQFVANHEIPFTCLIGDDATRNQVPEWVGYPTLLFLDRSRKVRARVVGYRTLIELEAIVELLLAEGAKTN